MLHWPNRLSKLLILPVLALMLVSCGQESSGGGEQLTYKDVKSMVIDILGSAEGQEAIAKGSMAKYGASSLHMQSLTPQDQEQVRIAVKDVLTSPEYDKVLQGIMTDPKFAGEFAKTISKENKQLHKDLLKDPGYQKEMITILQSPEMQKIFVQSTKMPEYRQLMMNAVQEAIQNPLFKLEIMKMLQTVVKEELNPDKKKQAGGEGGNQDGENSSDGSGGGEGESSEQ
jgi:spore germination protein D